MSCLTINMIIHLLILLLLAFISYSPLFYYYYFFRKNCCVRIHSDNSIQSLYLLNIRFFDFVTIPFLYLAEKTALVNAKHFCSLDNDTIDV